MQDVCGGIRTEKSNLARTEVVVKKGHFKGQKYRVEDYWYNVAGKHWARSFREGNPAAVEYAVRVELENLPNDDRVLYGKIGYLGHLIHESELEDG